VIIEEKALSSTTLLLIPAEFIELIKYQPDLLCFLGIWFQFV
jgi:hypothetical protein